MTEPNIDIEDEQEEIPTRRLAYLLIENGVVVGSTVIDVPEDQYDFEKKRLDTAHSDNKHVALDENADIPEVGSRI